MFIDEAHALNLHERLAKTERSEDRALTAIDRPFNNVALVWLQHRIDF